MNSLSRGYEHSSTELQRQAHWLNEAAKRPSNHRFADFKIAFPPPNVTGDLHMGHALNCSLQDALIRYQRLKGRSVHWQIGCDHAGIGTQLALEKSLKKRKLDRLAMSREEFEKEAWQWARRHSQNIYAQMRRLGCSPDWSRAAFTLDENYAIAVRRAFYEYFKRGLIYRGERLVNWCPQCQTSISDLEVEHDQRKGKLYSIAYALIDPVGDFSELVVCTARPETIFADVALAINPHDVRFTELIAHLKAGRRIEVSIPLTEAKIPIILSERVQLDFGTGVLKVTPAHDFNDYEICREWNSLRNQSEPALEPLNLFDKWAKLLPLPQIPACLHSMDRFVAREKTVSLLNENALMRAEQDYTQPMAIHDRCGTIIEPFTSKQWFVHMPPLAAKAIDAVANGNVRFHPQRYQNTYLSWLENIQDWCISRQLWWGHPIPVWVKANSQSDPSEAKIVHANAAAEFKAIAKACGYRSDLRSDAHHPTLVIGSLKDNEYIFQFTPESCQVVMRSPDPSMETALTSAGYAPSPDVLDTWFSSALWPMATLEWPNDANSEKTTAPWTDVLCTAREIINLWVARMVFSAQALSGGRLPFTDVLIHPVIQTPDGKRMSKSKGTGIDPIDLVERYGADACRMWYCSLGIYGAQDVPFPGHKDSKGVWNSAELDNRRRFLNKLWNSVRFVLVNDATTEGENLTSEVELTYGDLLLKSLNEGDAICIWILYEWRCLKQNLHENMAAYRFREYVDGLQKFVWNVFCDRFLEVFKVRTPDEQVLSKRVMRYILKEILLHLHPICPHITEELWINLKPHCSSMDELFEITDSELPAEYSTALNDALAMVENAFALIDGVRSMKQSILGLSDKFVLDLELVASHRGEIKSPLAKLSWWTKLACVSLCKAVSPEDFILCYEQPLRHAQATDHDLLKIIVPSQVDLSARADVITSECEKLTKKILNCSSKLHNEGFMRNAKPELKAQLQQEHDRYIQNVRFYEEMLKQIKTSLRVKSN